MSTILEFFMTMVILPSNPSEICGTVISTADPVPVGGAVGAIVTA